MRKLQEENQKTFEESKEIISRFFKDCKRHWVQEKKRIKDLKENDYRFFQAIDQADLILKLSAEELALKDIRALKQDPFVPNGDFLDIDAKEEFLKEKSEQLDKNINIHLNDYDYIQMLSEEKQRRIEHVLRRELSQFEFENHVLDEYVEDAMNSRISDLEDTVNRDVLEAIVRGDDYFIKISQDFDEVVDEYTYAEMTITRFNDGKQLDYTVWKNMYDLEEAPYIILDDEVFLLEDVVQFDIEEQLEKNGTVFVREEQFQSKLFKENFQKEMNNEMEMWG